jgi:hypothetical protein
MAAAAAVSAETVDRTAKCQATVTWKTRQVQQAADSDSDPDDSKGLRDKLKSVSVARIELLIRASARELARRLTADVATQAPNAEVALVAGHIQECDSPAMAHAMDQLHLESLPALPVPGPEQLSPRSPEQPMAETCEQTEGPSKRKKTRRS